jgi:CrcB protein
LALWLAVAIGGALGSLLRHGVNTVFAALLERPVPHATAVVNLIGSGAIGLLAGAIAAGRLPMSASMRGFVFAGVLGGFTTFSSYMLDTLTLAYSGEPGLALLNVTLQTLLGLAAIWAGYALAVGLN